MSTACGQPKIDGRCRIELSTQVEERTGGGLSFTTLGESDSILKSLIFKEKKEKPWKVNPMFLWKNTDCIENKFRHHFFHVQFWCVQSKLTTHEIFLTSSTIKKLFLYMSSGMFYQSWRRMKFFSHLPQLKNFLYMSSRMFFQLPTRCDFFLHKRQGVYI